MSTVSTRPDSPTDQPAGRQLAALSGEPGHRQVLTRRMWLAAAISILTVGSMLRVHHLELVPLHHDEGVNGYFLTGLFRTLTYHYNPENYHGPSLYYFALASAYLLGLNTFAIRITTAAFGIATMWIILIWKKQVGEVGSLVAGSFVAVSPGAVYFSRYFIHETPFVFFTLGAVVGLLRYRKGKKLSDLILAWSSASLLFATKETSLITVAVLVIAATSAALYVRFRFRLTAGNSDIGIEEAAGANGREQLDACSVTPGTATTWFSRWDVRAVDWGWAAAVAILLFLLLYSSFFVSPRGVVDALRAFRIWARTGEQQHTHVWSSYLGWLWQEEGPLLLLFAAGALITIWAARSKMAVFVSWWALGLLAVYSLIPYKTPWLALNFIIPMAIVVGCAADAVFKRMKLTGRLMAAALLCGALAVSAVQCIRLNFYHYDDDRDAYVYAHTQREFLGLVNDIEEAADQAGTGKTTSISVTSPDYWPLPWYLRNYSGVGYFGQVENIGAEIVVGSEAQQPQLDEMLGEQYVKVGYYSLRPGVVLVLYTRVAPAPG